MHVCRRIVRTQTSPAHVHVLLMSCTRLDTCMYAHLYMRTHMRTHTHARTRARVHAHAHIHASTQMCAQVMVELSGSRFFHGETVRIFGYVCVGMHPDMCRARCIALRAAVYLARCECICEGVHSRMCVCGWKYIFATHTSRSWAVTATPKRICFNDVRRHICVCMSMHMHLRDASACPYACLHTYLHTYPLACPYICLHH